MGEHEHAAQTVREERPIDIEGVPQEEGVSVADVAERADAEPEEQLNRPDQEDFDESERRQYQDPPLEPTMAQDDRPEDR